MGPQTWTVVGVFDAGGTAFESEVWGDSDHVIDAFGRGGYSSATFALADPALDFASVKARIEGDKRLNLVVKHERDYYAETAHNLTTFISIVGSILIVLFSFGAILGAMITMYAFVEARTREIGTLRALGFRRRAILLSFLIESALLSLAGAALAALPALFLQRLTFSTTNFDTFTDVTWHFRMSPEILVKGFVFALVMGLLGGLLPAARAARLPIVGALRKA
jgi:ABC-type antimicrobial peptide transport system permease subunit